MTIQGTRSRAEEDDDATAFGIASDHPSESEEDEADAADEEEEDGDRERSLRLVCAHGGETNRIRPPKGLHLRGGGRRSGAASNPIPLRRVW